MDQLNSEEITEDMLSFVLETGVYPAINKLYIIEIAYIILLYAIFFLGGTSEILLSVSLLYTLFRFDCFINFTRVITHYHRMMLSKLK